MFTIQIPQEESPREYKVLGTAKLAAGKLSAKLGVELDVVDADTNTICFVATPVEGRYFHPWERVETPAFQAPHFEGYRAAYTRKRIGAVVYRKIEGKGWLIWDSRSTKTREVATTKAACQLTSEMRQGLVL